MAADSASRYVSHASVCDSGASRRAARSSSAGASLPCVETNAICARSKSTRAPSSSSSAPASVDESRPIASSSAPARNFVCAATSARCARRAESGVNIAARSRNAAAAAKPPRACARAAERSSSSATSSSGTDAACARCHARRSGSMSGSVAAASARCASRCWFASAAPYTAERTSGCRNTTAPSSLSKPSDSTACAAVSGIPSCCAARHRSAGSPTGSAAASSSSCRASRGSRASRRVKLCSMPVESGSATGRPKPPASWAGDSPRGSSISASGFPPVSATIRSRTDSSSRAGRTDCNSARASRRPSGSTRSCGKRASPPPTTRRERERDPLGQ